jgi:hypothetical protein
VSYLWLSIFRVLHAPVAFVFQLRSINVLGLFYVYFLSRSLLSELARGDTISRRDGISKDHPVRKPVAESSAISHSAFNVSLFPPLFFFCALYYTDVLSAALVLLAYRAFLVRDAPGMLLSGLFSLLFRQTNVFWVSIYLGGLQLVRSLRDGSLDETNYLDEATVSSVMKKGWIHQAIYDPPLDRASLQGTLPVLYVPQEA